MITLGKAVRFIKSQNNLRLEKLSEKIYYKFLRNPNDNRKEQLFNEAVKCLESEERFGGWAISKNSLKALVNRLDESENISVLEFGSGISTIFLKEYFGARLILDSFEQHKEFADRISKRTNASNIRIHNVELRQYTDEEFLSIMNKEINEKNLSSAGKYLLKELYNDTRAKNVFYQIDSLEDRYDAVILDGPHGNGRSIAFSVVVNHLKDPGYILIDDLNHYPFLSDCSRFFDFNILYGEIYPKKRWALIETFKKR